MLTVEHGFKYLRCISAVANKEAERNLNLIYFTLYARLY